MGAVLSIFSLTFSIAWKVIKFTGAWISVILALLVDEVLLQRVLHIKLTYAAYPEIYPAYELGMIVMMLIPVILVTFYHIYRLVKPKEAPAPISSQPTQQQELSPVAREQALREIKEMAAELRRRREQEKK